MCFVDTSDDKANHSLIRHWSHLTENVRVLPSGQFSREPEVNVSDVHEGVDPLKKEATMEVKGNRLHVTRYDFM